MEVRGGTDPVVIVFDLLVVVVASDRHRIWFHLRDVDYAAHMHMHIHHAPGRNQTSTQDQEQHLHHLLHSKPVRIPNPDPAVHHYQHH